MKYLAVEIKGEIFVMNNNDELGGLIDGDIPHTVIGRVCTEGVIQHAYITVEVRALVRL